MKHKNFKNLKLEKTDYKSNNKFPINNPTNHWFKYPINIALPST